ncbi:MAG TPA: cell division protein ZapA [Bryobacteraceae bacterium]|nr:cell division protein ZapA [Bryobacteraceae bacterium]
METGNREKHPVRVTIANQTFTLLTTGEDREVLELAQQVDELITGIAARSPNADAARLAILACLHFADRLHTSEQQLQATRDRVQQRARSLLGLLDQVID